MRKILLLLLFGILLFGCTGQRSEFTTFKGADYSVDYPSGWSVSKIDAGDAFSSPQENNEDKVRDELIIEKLPEIKTFSDAEEVESYLIYEDEEILTNELITFKGREALLIEFEGFISEEDRTPLLYKTIYVLNNGAMYRLQYVVEKSKQDNYKPTMEKMLESFKFN